MLILKCQNIYCNLQQPNSRHTEKLVLLWRHSVSCGEASFLHNIIYMQFRFIQKYRIQINAFLNFPLLCTCVITAAGWKLMNRVKWKLNVMVLWVSALYYTVKTAGNTRHGVFSADEFILIGFQQLPEKGAWPHYCQSKMAVQRAEPENQLCVCDLVMKQ